MLPCRDTDACEASSLLGEFRRAVELLKKHHKGRCVKGHSHLWDFFLLHVSAESVCEAIKYQLPLPDGVRLCRKSLMYPSLLCKIIVLALAAPFDDL